MTGTGRARVIAPAAAVLALALAIALVWWAQERTRPIHRVDVSTTAARPSADDCPSDVQCILQPVRTAVSSSISAAFSNTALPVYESATVGVTNGRRYSETYVDQLDDGVLMTLTIRCSSDSSTGPVSSAAYQSRQYTVPGQIQLTSPVTDGCGAAIVLDVPVGYAATVPIGPAQALLALPSIQLSR